MSASAGDPTRQRGAPTPSPPPPVGSVLPRLRMVPQPTTFLTAPGSGQLLTGSGLMTSKPQAGSTGSHGTGKACRLCVSSRTFLSASLSGFPTSVTLAAPSHSSSC